MKKLILGLFTVALLFSCSKYAEVSNEEHSNVQNKLSKSNYIDTWVSSDQLEKQIEDLMQLGLGSHLSGIFPSDNDEGVSGFIIIFVEDNDIPFEAAKEVVCEGSSISFARCVDNWFDQNPNGCLEITQDGGNYTASTCGDLVIDVASNDFGVTIL